MLPTQRKIMMRKRWGVVLFFLAAILIFSSCRTPAGRTPGEVMDDTGITTKVKAKLYADDFLKGMSISVDTFEGRVTLTGAVENESQREHAGTLAKSVYGVVKVNNLLLIKKK